MWTEEKIFLGHHSWKVMKFPGRIFLNISYILYNRFFVCKNNHTCLSVFCYFSKCLRHLTHSCNQRTPPFNTFNISGRIPSFTNSLFVLQTLYGCCQFSECEKFLFSKINRITCVSKHCPHWVQQIFIVFFLS